MTKLENVDLVEKLFVKCTRYMSRIGKKPVQIPSGVTVAIDSEKVVAKGPKGELTFAINPRTSVEQKTDDKGNEVLLVTVQDEKLDAAIWGTMRSILDNTIVGVSTGWKKVLELNGVGFKMNLQGRTIVMSLGFSHEVRYDIIEGIDVSIEGNKMTITGVDRQKVGKVASEIRAFKKPEPYKGKGFKYDDEIIRRKVGKTAGKGE